MATKLSDYLKNKTSAIGSAATTIKKTAETMAKGVGSGVKTLTGGGSIKTTVKPVSTPATPTTQKYSVADAVKNISSQSAVDDIRKRLEAFSKNKPADYVGSYQENISKLAEQIANRGEFSYDPTSDGLWEIYKNKYTEQGKMAMADTLGKAAAMNSGYGTSYGQTAGQQVYNQYMQQLADIIPELEQRAYDRWTDEETALLNQLAMYQGLDETEYGRYRDELGDYYTDYSLEKDLLDTERSIYENDRNYKYQVLQDEIANALAREQFSYQKEQDAIANALSREQFDYQKKQDKIANDLNAEKWEYSKKQYDAELEAEGDDEGYAISASALSSAKNGAKTAYKTAYDNAYDEEEGETAAIRAVYEYIDNLPEEIVVEYADEIANELGYPSYQAIIDLRNGNVSIDTGNKWR